MTLVQGIKKTLLTKKNKKQRENNDKTRSEI